MEKELEKKVQRAISLLQSVAKGYDGEIEVAYSGGKDSDVILQLAKESGIRYRAIYKNTTIDPPGTIAHVKSKGVEVRMPKESFLKLIERKGYPSRRARFCCEELKEYKILDRCIMGVRKCESKSREENYDEPTACRIYKKKGDHVNAIYPILEWTDEDVEAFIKERGIKCHPLYYDEQGRFHVERRLGCVGCPLAYKKRRIKEFKQYPKMVRAWVRAGQKYLETHPQTVAAQTYANGAEFFVRTVYFDYNSQYDDFVNTLFGKTDCKKFLEDYFNITL